MFRPFLAATLTAMSLIGGCTRSTAALNESEPTEKTKIRVLYAGVPEDPRTAEFVAFLEKHFVLVGTTSYSAFTPKDADGYDVVVFDAEPKPSTNAIGLPPSPHLPLDFDRASVLVGGAGVLATMPLKLKLDWL
jgi:hypothetical protein